ncbi:unnamed protein product, partial [Ectocarpus sp. 12 AP-2014]
VLAPCRHSLTTHHYLSPTLSLDIPTSAGFTLVGGQPPRTQHRGAVTPVTRRSWSFRNALFKPPPPPSSHREKQHIYDLGGGSAKCTYIRSAMSIAMTFGNCGCFNMGCRQDQSF